MRLKTNTPQTQSQTQQTPPASYTATPPTVTAPQTTVSPQTLATPRRTRRRLPSLVVRVALWATFLIPLWIVGAKVPQAVYERSPHVRPLLPVAYGQAAISTAYSHDGKLLALLDAKPRTPGKGGATLVGVTFWNPATHQRVGKRVEFLGMPQRVLFSGDNKELLLLSPNNTRTVNTVTGEVGLLPVYTTVSADGTVATQDMSVRIDTFSLKGNRVLDSYQIPEALLGVYFSHRVISLSPKADFCTLIQDSKLHVWRQGGFHPLWKKESDWAGKAKFSPDGKFLLATVATPLGERLRCLETKTGLELWERPLVSPNLLTDFQRPAAFAISPDSQTLVLRLSNGIRVLRLSDASLITHLGRPPQLRPLDPSAYSMSVLTEPALAFSPDGKTLAERLPDGVYLWNMAGVTSK